MEEKALAYTEVNEILRLMEEEYVQKVPQKIRDFFKEEKSDEYKPVIDVEKPLTEQNIKRETLVLLAVLNLNYWCENEEEKQGILKELVQNEESKKILEGNFVSENLLKENIQKIGEAVKEEPCELVMYKEKGFINKFISKIARIFKRG